MKTAVVLFNLGGPDSLENVRPFLYNLFNDKAIISLPAIFRKPLARFISSKRNQKAQDIYKLIGGKSPIVEETQAQANALQSALGNDHKVFICMRYWHPMSAEVATQVKTYAPDKIILLPLYPQFSTTTTGSSFKDFKRHFPSETNFKEICCYPLNPDFLVAHITQIKPQLEKYPTARVLFSAHGLPEKIIAKGDPYQWQIEQTAAAIARELNLQDWRVCYQSKVGPLPWLKPNTIDEITAATGRDLIIVPIAFISEHSETLVELDIEYKHLADKSGVKNYIRIPALGVHELFIKTLRDLCMPEYQQQKICPDNFSKCWCKSSAQ